MKRIVRLFYRLMPWSVYLSIARFVARRSGSPELEHFCNVIDQLKGKKVEQMTEQEKDMLKYYVEYRHVELTPKQRARLYGEVAE